jgi:hypothetical protein
MAPGMLKPYQPPVAPEGVVNVTDHDSRVVRTHGQPPLQGYNAQMAVNDQQVVIAAEITTESPDFGHLEPMVRATRRELAAVDLRDPEVVLGDAGYWHQRQIEAVVGDGIQVLVPPDAGLRKGARPGWTGGLYDFMRRVLATPAGAPSTASARSPSSPCSARSSSTARSDASTAAAGPHAEANGGSSPRRTTCSSSTTTAPRPSPPETRATTPRAPTPPNAPAAPTRSPSPVFPTASPRCDSERRACPDARPSSETGAGPDE